MKKYIQDFKVLQKRILSAEYYVLDLSTEYTLPEIFPGQFVELEIKGNESVFLRRPFSIHDVNYETNTISILVQIVGNGTRHLSNIEEGSKLNMIYPLGKEYNLIDKGKKALLIGGGCGVAPLLYLARQLNSRGVNVSTLVGVRSKDFLIEIDLYKQFGEVLITTEDGSLGSKGFVTNHPVFENLNQFDRIYTCGPEVMMKAIAKRAETSGVDCEVSLENSMACGIGACLCCVTETKEGNKCVCTEGPVFNIKELAW